MVVDVCKFVTDLQKKRNSQLLLCIISDDIMEYINWNNLLSASFLKKCVVVSMDDKNDADVDTDEGTRTFILDAFEHAKSTEVAVRDAYMRSLEQLVAHTELMESLGNLTF